MHIDIEKLKQSKSTKELISFGILNIDKPAGCTSFDVVNHVRKKLGLSKAGHFGTLDPQVTGVLPICLEKACKIQGYFMQKEKVYTGKMKLHKPIEKEKLEIEMNNFLGIINQLPPRKSRVKRQVREREIIEFKLIELNSETREAGFIARVQAGTYIRKLVADLGENIGGAHMIELRRNQAGLFSDKDAEFISLEEFDKVIEGYEKGSEKELRKLIIPAEIITKSIELVEVNQEAVAKLKNGSPIFEEMLINPEEAIKIIDKKVAFAVVCKDNLIEIAKKDDNFKFPNVLAKAECVLV